MILFLLASAIATAEGWFNPDPSVIPRRLNNPGNLRNAPWLAGAKKEKGFVHFNSAEEGIAGLYHQLALDVSRGLTLEQLIRKYSPASDGNNTENYIVETMRRVKIERDVPIQNYLTLERIA
jgi:hypothetical protein